MNLELEKISDSTKKIKYVVEKVINVDPNNTWTSSTNFDTYADAVRYIKDVYESSKKSNLYVVKMYLKRKTTTETVYFIKKEN